MERSLRFFSGALFPVSVAAALFVVLGLYAFVTYSNYRALVAQEVGAHEALLERIAAEAEGFIESRITLVKSLADTLALRAGTSLERQDVLALFLARHPEFGRVSIFDTAGHETAGDSRFTTLRTPDFESHENDPDFLAARGGGVHVGSLRIGIAEGIIPSVQIAVPIFENTTVVQGVVLAELDLRQLWDVVSQITVGERGAAYIADGEGRLAAHPDRQYALTTENVGNRAPIVRSRSDLADRRYGIASGEYINQENMRVFGLAKALPFGWTAAVEEPYEDFFQTSRALLRINAVVLAGAAMLGVFLLFLSGAFSRLFRAREEERAEKTDIIENLSDGLLVVDDEGTISSMNKKARDLLFAEGVADGMKILPNMKYSEAGLLPEVLYPAGIPGGLFRHSRVHKEFYFTEPLEQYLEIEVLPVPVTGRARPRAFLLVHDVTRDRVLSHLKSEFISIAAHQLRTPLSAVKWVFRLLLDGDLGKITEHQRTYIGEGYETNERMIHLVNDLLSVSRIEEGRFDFSFKKGDITKTALQVVAEFGDIAAQQEIAITLERPASPLPEILFDEERIMMVLQNLIENAFHYTNPKGSVTVALSEDEHNILVRVTDTGIGISKAEQARLFTKFYRSEGAVRIYPSGTGLGLFIARNIVLRHGGVLRVESEIGKGSTFVVALPKIKA